MTTIQTAEAPTTFGAWIKGYFRRFGEVLKHPKMLIPTLVLVAVWIILGIIQNHVRANLPMKVLNFLTFAQGGLYGGFIGAIGGILGKVAVAAFFNMLLLPLVMGRRPSTNYGTSMQSFKESFKVDSSKALKPLFMGIGIALLLYVLFNWTQSVENSMVGITSATAALLALGRKNGMLWGLASSLVGSFSKGKAPDSQRVARLLTGISLGFATGVVLTFMGSYLSLPMGIISIIVALFFGKNKKRQQQ